MTAKWCFTYSWQLGCGELWEVCTIFVVDRVGVFDDRDRRKGCGLSSSWVVVTSVEQAISQCDCREIPHNSCHPERLDMKA